MALLLVFVISNLKNYIPGRQLGFIQVLNNLAGPGSNVELYIMFLYLVVGRILRQRSTNRNL